MHLYMYIIFVYLNMHIYVFVYLKMHIYVFVYLKMHIYVFVYLTCTFMYVVYAYIIATRKYIIYSLADRRILTYVKMSSLSCNHDIEQTYYTQREHNYFPCKFVYLIVTVFLQYFNMFYAVTRYIKAVIRRISKVNKALLLVSR